MLFIVTLFSIEIRNFWNNVKAKEKRQQMKKSNLLFLKKIKMYFYDFKYLCTNIWY